MLTSVGRFMKVIHKVFFSHRNSTGQNGRGSDAPKEHVKGRRRKYLIGYLEVQVAIEI